MNLGPYHIARLRALADAVPEAHAIEVGGEQKLYPWRPSRDRLGFAVTTLFPDRPCEGVPAREQCEAVRMSLSRIDPGVVIVAGYREPVMRAAAKWARDRRRPTILLVSTTLLECPRVWWKELLKGWLVRRYTLVAATGLRAGEYVQGLGFPKDLVHYLGNVVDNAYFSQVADVASGIPDDPAKQNSVAPYFLAVSRLVSAKNLDRLLEAFVVYRARGGVWNLVILGSGPQESDLRAKAQELNMAGIQFLGWKSYEELPQYYVRASCFVLASVSEAWGLVVNEAMACGLPVLVSENCGCVPELCRNGENGYTFNPHSTEDLAEAMLRISSDEERLSAFGQVSRRIISSFTPQTWAVGLKNCITAALDEKRL